MVSRLLRYAIFNQDLVEERIHWNDFYQVVLIKRAKSNPAIREVLKMARTMLSRKHMAHTTWRDKPTHTHIHTYRRNLREAWRVHAVRRDKDFVLFVRFYETSASRYSSMGLAPDRKKKPWDWITKLRGCRIAVKGEQQIRVGMDSTPIGRCVEQSGASSGQNLGRTLYSPLSGRTSEHFRWRWPSLLMLERTEALQNRPLLSSPKTQFY